MELNRNRFFLEYRNLQKQKEPFYKARTNPFLYNGFITGVLCAFLALQACNNEKKVELSTPASQKSTDYTSKQEVIQIGIAAVLSPEKALPVYEGIANYIGKKLGRDTELVFAKDYSSMNNLIKSKEVTVAFVSSGPYVKGHDEWGMEILAAPKQNDNTLYYSYIITNKNSSFDKLDDLKNKRFAFTDPESNTGKIAPTYRLLLAGKTPEKFFSEYIYTGSHDKSIEAVAERLVDGAAVDNFVWEYYNTYDSTFTSQTKIIERLGPYCIPPIVTNPDCDIKTKKELRNILLNMHKDPEGQIILNKLLIERFVTVDDSCYQSIRKMNKWIEKKTKQN